MRESQEAILGRALMRKKAHSTVRFPLMRFFQAELRTWAHDKIGHAGVLLKAQCYARAQGAWIARNKMKVSLRRSLSRKLTLVEKLRRSVFLVE